jgi:deoxyribose-phosphate aldolase
MESPACFIDHTLLRADATSAQIQQLCRDAQDWGFASVCIPPRFVSVAAACLQGTKVAVGTVVGFPLGYDVTATKCAATAQAVAAGAREIDMVIPLGAAMEGRLDVVREDVCRVLDAACGHTLKVIIECCYLDNALKEQLVELLADAGVAYVKTSTGFARAGATVEDIRLLHRAAQGRLKVKAAGGIRDWESCRAMLEAGAQRVGTSNGVGIMHQWQREQAR